MKCKLIFDASVLVNAYLAGNVHKTGLYRVSDQVLKGFVKRDLYDIYLYDIFGRERELKRYIQPFYKNVKILSTNSWFEKVIVYPFLNLSDSFRIKEQNSKKSNSFYKFFKNIFYFLGNGFQRFAEKKEKFKEISFLTHKDIYLSIYYPIPDIPYLRMVRKSIIIHDLIPLIHPEYFPSLHNNELLQEIIQSIGIDDRVICVSKSTKNDLMKYRKDLRDENIFVSHLAGAEEFFPVKKEEKIAEVKKRYQIPTQKPYFLSVCTIEPRKNIKLLVEAYWKFLKKTQKQDQYPVLVLTGAYGWKSKILLDEIEKINEYYPNAILLTGFVTDEELAVLYSNTNAFIYPSLYEGFGLPPLEAMQCGAPVIASNNSSLPEVVGSAAMLIDAHDSDGLSDMLNKCLNDEVHNEMSKKSIVQAAKFSWDKTVDSIIQII